MSGDRAAIGIVGMACVFPKAPNLASYWQNILDRVDALGEPPPNWGAELAYDQGSSIEERRYTLRGGYLGELGHRAKGIAGRPSAPRSPGRGAEEDTLRHRRLPVSTQ